MKLLLVPYVATLVIATVVANWLMTDLTPETVPSSPPVDTAAQDLVSRFR